MFGLCDEFRIHHYVYDELVDSLNLQNFKSEKVFCEEYSFVFLQAVTKYLNKKVMLTNSICIRTFFKLNRMVYDTIIQEYPIH